MVSISVAQFSHPGLAFTDLIALLMAWLHTDRPIDELETPEAQARTAAYAFRMIRKERFEQNLEELLEATGPRRLIPAPAAGLDRSAGNAAVR